MHLRARYYQPEVGRFFQRDPLTGVPTLPQSLNPYTYSVNNPVLYVDPSGQNPVAAAIALIVGGGFVLGAAAGSLVGYLTYDMCRAGQCGCDLQQRALSVTYEQWVGAATLGGGVLGGASVVIAGLVGYIGPGALIFIAGVGMYFSAWDFVETIEIIRNETGLTWCTGIRLLIDTTTFIMSAIGFVQGINAWRASGSLIEWAPAQRNLPGAIPDEQPRNLIEQLALDEAKTSAGEIIIAELGDSPRLEAVYQSGDWVKMQHVHRGHDGSNIVIHWFEDLKTGLRVEFKFLNR